MKRKPASTSNEFSIDRQETLYSRIAKIIEDARYQVAQTANLAMVHCYYEIGRMIVADEQNGKARADYGQKTLQALSKRLTDSYGKGFSHRNLKLFRQFYLAYSTRNAIGQTASAQLKQSAHSSTKFLTTKILNQKDELPAGTHPDFQLAWSHYIQLLHIDDPRARRFYEIEAAKGNWSVRWLGRQIASSLYERVALSKDQSKVIELSQHGNVPAQPQDLLKEPYVLEFLGMHEEEHYTESDLETKLINHLQEFLLELGTGFAFIGRQVRFSFEEEHFFVDLVFYNRLLRCFVLFDLKTDRLTHQDIGQMQMYVHYDDRYVRKEFENPTIGILLCRKKNEAVVKITLPENENIYAAEYKLYLPDAQLLQQKLNEWINAEDDNFSRLDEDTTSAPSPQDNAAK